MVTQVSRVRADNSPRSVPSYQVRIGSAPASSLRRHRAVSGSELREAVGRARETMATIVKDETPRCVQHGCVGVVRYSVDMQHVLILAGGSGTRLWPLSHQGEPKQLLELIDGMSLLVCRYRGQAVAGAPG